MRSGVKFSNGEAIVEDDINYTNILCETVPDGLNGALSSFKCGPAGFETPIFLIGMQPNETVDLFGIQPDGSSKTLTPFQANDRGSGYVNLQFRPDSPPGYYALNFVGRSSHKTATEFERLFFPNFFEESKLYLSIASSAYYDLTDPNPTFFFNGVGFAPGQIVNMELEGPKGNKITKTVTANEYGSVSGSFSYQDLDKASPGAPPDGEWSLRLTSTIGNLETVTEKFVVSAAK